MVTVEIAREMALSLPGTLEQDHFGLPSFRVNNRIFSTLWIKENLMMVKLSPIDQSVFNSIAPSVFYPVPNKWGLGGATFVELDSVLPEMLADALKVAYDAIVLKPKGKKK
jgi:YjbR